MERRTAILNTLGVAGITAMASSNVFAQDKQSRFGDSIIPKEKESGKEKHVPFIDAPKQVKAGEAFNVTVEVGKVVPHPNTFEHHIRSMQLYLKEDGSDYLVNVASIELEPTRAIPKVTVSVILQKPTTLYALEYCNLHGVWENSLKVNVI